VSRARALAPAAKFKVGRAERNSRRRSSPTSPAFSLPTTPPTSPAPRSMPTAGVRRSS